uniref:Putative sap domain-containing ribonucleoprotein n=1 Tax=Haematobia irritans TaxID=7368 RepID=A0A1L8EI78_HAEIR
MPITDVSSLKVADLKRELKERGLSVAGNKNELQDRLQSAMEGEPLLEDSSIVGEDILDEGVLSDEEKILGADENELLKSPTTTPTTLLPKGGSGDASLAEEEILESPTSTAKKIVLKRKISVNSGQSNDSANTTAKENTEPSLPKTSKVSDRAPITVGDTGAAATSTTKKFSEMTMQERLELRAKKFGMSATTTAAPTSTNDKSISQAPAMSSEKQVELLKKRAERFGCVTSTNLAKLDAEERRLKRMQRFGGEKQETTTPTASSEDWAEKAKKRLERFGGNASAKPAATPSVAAAASN